jgi:peptidoglycan-N-acetylglucosamine deacetylase
MRPSVLFLLSLLSASTNLQAQSLEIQTNEKLEALSTQELTNIEGWRAALQERNQLDLALTNKICRYPRLAINTPFNYQKGSIALTFDDGPRPATTPIILDILEKYKITATFFVKGANMKGNEQILRRIVKDGHNIGNHSYSHPNFHKISTTEARSQIVKTKKLIDPYLPEDRMKLLRFPYGNSTCEAEYIADALNYQIVGWTVDSCDWDYAAGFPTIPSCLGDAARTAQYRNDYAGWVNRQVARRGGGVVLMHDVHNFTMKNLETLIRDWLNQGYTFVSVDQVMTTGPINNFNIID